jgi:acyl carrier protein
MTETETKLREILCLFLGINTDQIQPSSDIIKDLGADSWDVVEIIMEIEDEFQIAIDDEDVLKIKTFQDVLALVDKESSSLLSHQFRGDS